MDKIKEEKFIHDRSGSSKKLFTLVMSIQNNVSINLFAMYEALIEVATIRWEIPLFHYIYG